jgi:hypothetical protein
VPGSWFDSANCGGLRWASVSLGTEQSLDNERSVCLDPTELCDGAASRSARYVSGCESLLDIAARKS